MAALNAVYDYPGITALFNGLIRGKNVLSMLTQVTVTFALVCILWVVYGYSLAFGEGNNFFGNFNWVLLKNIALTAVWGAAVHSRCFSGVLSPASPLS